MLARKPIYQHEHTTTKQTIPRTNSYSHAATNIQAKSRVKEKVSWLLTVGICASMAMFVVSQYAVITKTSYQVDQINQQIHASSTKYENLQAESVSLSNSKRIIDIALTKLHMQFVSQHSAR
ncbi:cell division protein FtsL [Fodinisporobacter ferrooxydans]|uniref:Cell division protein FtsL n=1 Tax=Fodinisporobacter ferrooxydans TaxID=2901836 RepID=A0ABY4CGK9_9BACL|nr:cell division protein FtsL [Alicyclobacillaceae bacterium MYW30-H2]